MGRGRESMRPVMGRCTQSRRGGEAQRDGVIWLQFEKANLKAVEETIRLGGYIESFQVPLGLLALQI